MQLVVSIKLLDHVSNNGGGPYAYRVKILFDIREKDVVDELEKLEGEGWHTLMEDA